MTDNIEYRQLQIADLTHDLFRHFNRRQVVKDCWRRVDGEWIIKEAPFIDDWSEKDYQFLIQCLRNTVNTGGVVYGAFKNEQLKGFTSVEAEPLGSKGQYLDLSCIHVSEDMRGQGMGKSLFSFACNWAREHGAEKLYISAHSAVETQSFYRAQGCVEAEEYNREHVEKEPYDCQMEYVLRDKV